MMKLGIILLLIFVVTNTIIRAFLHKRKVKRLKKEVEILEDLQNKINDFNSNMKNKEDK